MKLAEALILRKDLQNRMEELRSRLSKNALVQEGDKPAEKPADLLKELYEDGKQLQELMTRINLTNAKTRLEDGQSLTEKLAQRESLTLEISILRSFLNTATANILRSGRNEIKICSTVDVAKLQKEIDDLSKKLRTLDTSIQASNWTTELQ